MENFSIYKYMKLGIVHFKAYPQATTGEGPIVETLRKIVEDDFWTAVEVGWMKDPKVRHEATKLLETSHMEVCYANQPRMFALKLNINDFDSKERKRAMSAMKNGVNEAFQLGATCMRVFSGKHPGEEKKEEAKKILIDSLKEICQYTKEQGPMGIYMKVFDYDIDKCFLIGHFRDAADVAVFLRFGQDGRRRCGACSRETGRCPG
ncbi:MAG: TIM barrel protein, partial [Thermodesulfobacteriota bacterium]